MTTPSEATSRKPIARSLLEVMTGETIQQTGFIRNDTLRIGCSPDGLLGTKRGAEIKSCLADIQVERLIKGGLPSEHRAQVEGSLLTSGLDSWTFFSFSPGMPPLLVEVTLTDERRDVIEDELFQFNEELDELVNKIKGMF